MESHTDIERKYQIKKLHDQILSEPDTYTGSTRPTEVETWIYDKSQGQMEFKPIQLVQALYKIFDECVVNAYDHWWRLQHDADYSTLPNKVSQIRIDVNKSVGEISVMNNGEGIPVQIHKEHNMYVPQMIFGNLLSSGNYDKKGKMTGGKNGYGAKLANIFAKSFTIETVDAITKKRYIQVFSDNMKTVGEPKITATKDKPYTKVSFIPDFARFNIDGIDDSFVALAEKRAFDLAACMDGSVAVYFNGAEIPIKDFDSYVSLYLGSNKKTAPRFYEKCGDRWEVIVAMSSDEEFENVSFVNGIYTRKGGKHVEAVARHVSAKIQAYVRKNGYKRTKSLAIKQENIKRNLSIFVRCCIEDPAFSSQTKDELETAPEFFGSKFEATDDLIDKLVKQTQIVERTIALTDHKEKITADITLGTPRSKTIRGIPKLDDANFAGDSKHAGECTLIITEGDSAKATAISGLAVTGRDRYGVFPIRGKLLNAKKDTKKLEKNEEIQNICKILGLQTNKKISNPKDLRYGRIMLMTDQDTDGSHIKGLLINLIHTFWPELTRCKGFISSLATPIVKATKRTETKAFYTLSEYKAWKAETDTKGWSIKYYKGLGTNTATEAREYFKTLNDDIISYVNISDECEQSINMAFLKDNEDDRKEWLMNYNPDNIIEQKQKDVPISDFINKELIHFSMESNERALPSLIDGLKPSQRKILYAAFKRKLTTEIKVSQFAGYVSEHTCYHHGEESLYKTIVGMAQNFVGSNNINLLAPAGQFGTRLKGGDDSASPRYIFTNLEKIAYSLFNPLDFPLLDYLDDDGYQIEPRFYVPLLPMILINGSKGIGTGYSTQVLLYNPVDVIGLIKRLLNDEQIMDGNTFIKPWYRGFTGKIEHNDNRDSGASYITRGSFEVLSDTIEITELPIGLWTDGYKEFLEAQLNAEKIISYHMGARSSDTLVHIVLKFKPNVYDNYKYNPKAFEKDFKLCNTLATTNMHVFNRSGKIVKYEYPEEIVMEFFEIRMEFYAKRKAYILAKLMREVDIIQFKVRFIEDIYADKIVITKKLKKEIEAQLESATPPYLKFNVGDDNDTEGATYNYLLRMPIHSLSMDTLAQLRKEMEDKQAELNILQSKTEKDLYREDLDEFEQLYAQYLAEYEASLFTQNETKKVKIAIKKTPKTIGRAKATK